MQEKLEKDWNTLVCRKRDEEKSEVRLSDDTWRDGPPGEIFFSHESRKLDANVTKNVTSQILDVH